MTIELPILKDNDGVIAPLDGACLQCGGSTGNDQISIQGGALAVSDNGRFGIPSDRMAAFFTMVVIQDRNGERHVFQNKIVDQLIGGQFMIYWCSLDCMRKTLNGLVNQMQKQILD